MNDDKCDICGTKLEHGLCSNRALVWHSKYRLAFIQPKYGIIFNEERE